MKKRASKLLVETKPVCGFPNDAENMRKSSRACLFCRKACRSAGASDGAVRLRIPVTFEGSTHDCGYSMIPGYGLADVERGTKGGARGDEKRITPRDDTGKLAFPQDVLNSLATFATGASASIKNGPQRVRTGVLKDATAQQPSTIVSDRQQHGALLVIELGESEKLDAAGLRID